MTTLLKSLLICLIIQTCHGLNFNDIRSNSYNIISIVGDDGDNEIPDMDETISDKKSFLDVGPPPHKETARMARYVTHQSNWAAMATIAVREPIVGFPFANVFSVSDGTVDNSTVGQALSNCRYVQK